MVQVLPAFVSIPVRIVFQQFDVQAIQPSGRLDVEGVFPNLSNRGDSGKLQKVPEMVSQFFEFAHQRGLFRIQALRMNYTAIGCESELRFVFCSGWAFDELLKNFGYRVAASFGTGRKMDVVSLQDRKNTITDHIGLVGRVLSHTTQSLKRRRFVAECFEKSVRKLSRVERLFDQLADCFFNLDRVQRFAPSIQ